MQIKGGMYAMNWDKLFIGTINENFKTRHKEHKGILNFLTTLKSKEDNGIIEGINDIMHTENDNAKINTSGKLEKWELPTLPNILNDVFNTRMTNFSIQFLSWKLKSNWQTLRISAEDTHTYTSSTEDFSIEVKGLQGNINSNFGRNSPLRIRICQQVLGVICSQHVECPSRCIQYLPHKFLSHSTYSFYRNKVNWY